MILEDLHTHTTYCDGNDTPEDMVKEAIKKGLLTIGFSGHVYLKHGEDYCMSRENTKKYYEEVNGLKDKYKEQITVLCGIEDDLYSVEDTSGFDYVIGSVHDIKVGNEFVTIDYDPETFEKGVKKHFDGDFYTACEKYFESLPESIAKTRADIIGHIGLVTKFNEKCNFFDENHPRYVNAWKKAIDKLIPFNIPFEINTGAMSRGWRTFPYPSFDMLCYIAKKGGSVIFTGDIHAKENLCYKHEELEQIAKDAGFTKRCYAYDILNRKNK
ncbi:MAG: histidinol-phosphatase [Clostridia bacterium]|nr:histidinol-phosphatase [Clostridia bacterium]